MNYLITIDPLKKENEENSNKIIKIYNDKYLDARPFLVNFYSLNCKLGIYKKAQNDLEKYSPIENFDYCYEDILTQKPDYIPALSRLMYIYSSLNDKKHDPKLCEAGISFATRWIRVAETAEAYIERGNLRIDLYELEKAVEDCKKAVELDPDAFYAYNNMGCALLALRRIEEAIVPLKQAIDLDPDKDYLPYMNLAKCYTLIKEYDKAISAYRKVLVFRPKDSNIENELVKIYILK